MIGAVFFMMERRRGIVVRDRNSAGPERFSGLSGARQPRIHRLPHRIAFRRHLTHGLDSFGKPAGFLERQVRGWFERWNRAKTEEIPLWIGSSRWLGERMPGIAGADHGAQRFQAGQRDAEFRAIPERVEAVLDWEMSTRRRSVGRPRRSPLLLDAAERSGRHETDATSAPGWFSRDELVEHYAVKTGRDVSHIDYYEVFAIFKLAVVLQQIYVRFHRGQTQDERFRHFDKRVRNLIRTSRRIDIIAPAWHTKRRFTHVSDRIATITLNRPDKLNAWTAIMEKEVRRQWSEAEQDGNVRVIVLTGAGRGFCAGADMSLLETVIARRDRSICITILLRNSGNGRARECSRRIFRRNIPIFLRFRSR